VSDLSNAMPLLRQLRDELSEQATPVVRALYDWSAFAPKGSWGMITSSWAAQFITICERLGSQALAAPIMEAFFAGNDDIGRMQPRTHPVSMHGVTHLYQRRASCCRYYLLPQGNLCASCPLVSHDERLRRNIEFMERQLSRSST
jgi:ferric iron reductase protein FhuF